MKTILTLSGMNLGENLRRRRVKERKKEEQET
jgi:hypothetical protein